MKSFRFVLGNRTNLPSTPTKIGDVERVNVTRSPLAKREIANSLKIYVNLIIYHVYVIPSGGLVTVISTL